MTGSNSCAKPLDLTGAISILAVSTLPHRDIARMARAAAEYDRCASVLARTGENAVSVLLRGARTFLEWSHYPENDAHDPVSHAQYYYHAHPPESRPWNEHGHFHLFLRPKAMPPDAVPLRRDEDADAPCHVVAVSLDPYGQPTRLFTTNRWVTGESWYAGPDIIRALGAFDMDVAQPNWVVNRWISSLAALFRPQIEELIRQRDTAVAQWTRDHPDADVFEDRSLEITSQIEIDVGQQIAAIRATLASSHTGACATTQIRCTAHPKGGKA